MITFNRFKDGKSKIITMSYDDGTVFDRKLVEVFNKYGFKGTFHLNSAFLGHDGRITAEEIPQLYKGHEVSLHMDTHPFPTLISDTALISSVMNDRLTLEKASGSIVKGMSYPYGDYNDSVISALRSMGVVYSRTTITTHGFGFPNDFLAWHPTCHHHDMLEDGKNFLSQLNRRDKAQLFYIWGHSYEFDRENNWDMIEEACKMLSGIDDVWYATNIEIYHYIQAIKRMEVSADNRIIHNPSAIPIWFTYDKETYKIDAGETLQL